MRGGGGGVEGTVQCRESIMCPEEKPGRFTHDKVDHVQCATNAFT